MPKDIKTKEGSDTQQIDLREFNFKGWWGIRWDAQGESFEVRLLNKEGKETFGSPWVSQKPSGKGTSYAPSGKYFLKIEARATWKVIVFDVH